MTSQLALGITLRDDATLDGYYPSSHHSNQEALWSIRHIVAGRRESFIYVWGRLGVGRTHLLQGACLGATLLNRAAVYLPLAEPHFLEQSPLILQGLEKLDLLCLDDIQAICGNQEWEEAIFHLYNRLRSAGGGLLIAAERPAVSLNFVLADLRSRLSAGLMFHLEPLSDEEKITALQLRAKIRGLDLSQEVGRFLIRRCERTMTDLYQLLDKLDQASLAAQRRLTIPFVKEILAL